MNNFKKIENSIEFKFSSLAKKMNKDGKKIISLGLGEPNFQTPAHIIDEAYRALKLGFTRYSSPIGLTELRKAVCSKLKIDNNIKSSENNIVITSGAKMSMFLTLMAILNPKDKIINFTPCYPSYIPQVIIAQNKAKIINFNLSKKNFSINFEKLENIFKKNKIKAIIINFPNNPTGKILSKNEFDQLVSILKKNNCYIIADEIYDKFNFSNKKIYSLGSISSFSNRTIIINGFSKSFSMTGWRIGYLKTSTKIIDSILKLQQHINTNVPTFIQKAALAGLTNVNKDLIKSNRELFNNYNYLKIKFDNSKYLKFNESHGGFFNFIDISNLKIHSDDFCESLLKKYNVAATPGFYFGKNWDKFVRISMANNFNEFKKGIDLMDIHIRENIKK